MTAAVSGLRPQPLPGPAVPGTMPGTTEPDVWTPQIVATMSLTASGLHGEERPLQPAPLQRSITPHGPKAMPEPAPPAYIAVGTSFDDAVKAAAKLTFDAAGVIDMSPNTNGPAPASQTVAVMQAADGTYYATGMRFAGSQTHSIVPAVGVPLHDGFGKTTTFSFNKQSDALKALVWADQWVDFSAAKVGESASVGG